MRLFHRSIIAVLTLSFFVTAGIHQLRADDPKLLGHWKLSGDTRDRSGQGNDAANHGGQLTAKGPADQANSAVLLDGRDDYLLVENAESLNTGTGNFSVAGWVHIAKDLDDVPGDVISKFDPKTRTGFELSIRNNVGVTNSQANYRNVHFGIDNGRLSEKWTDRGRPGNNIYVFSLTAFEGNLYAGTCEPGTNESGHVYRYDGEDRWIDCGTPDRCNAVTALAVHDGALFAAVSKYRLRGSALSESENDHPGGKVFRYAGGKNWVDCGKLGEAKSVFGMVVYRGALYASAMYSPGLFRYEGGTKWTDCGSPDGKRVEALAVYNGAIYATGFDEAGVYRYDGSQWEHLGIVGPNTQTYGFAVYRGELYVTTWRSGRVYRNGGGTNWIDVGRLGEELESMPLAVYNGKLYSGSLPLGEVFRYDGRTTWTSIGRVDETPDVKYRRAWSMAVFDGKLFVGALPSGRVKSIEAGKSVTYDFELKPGWKHLAAVKEDNRLKLYIDGRLVGTSSEFDPSAFNLNNAKPLKIGFGQHDYFNGRLSDVRMHGRALGAEEIAQLANAR